jgi:hypothetical protein
VTTFVTTFFPLLLGQKQYVYIIAPNESMRESCTQFGCANIISQNILLHIQKNKKPTDVLPLHWRREIDSGSVSLSVNEDMRHLVVGHFHR